MATKDAPQMQVLVLGLPRTNTTSLTSALRILGYNPYTMRHLLTQPSHIPIWTEYAETVQRQQSTQTPTPTSPAAPLPPSITSLLAPHTAIADLPGCIFAPQLISTYPSAKVILTTRSYPAWETSMHNSLYCLLTWRLFSLCRTSGFGALAPLIRLLHALFGLQSGNAYSGPQARQAYEAHNQRVRDLVPRERLLEVDVEDEVGWRELCAFLGEEVPSNRRFPGEEGEGKMRMGFEKAWWGIVWYLLTMVVLPSLLTVVGVVGWFYQEDVGREVERWVLRPVRGWAFGPE